MDQVRRGLRVGRHPWIRSGGDWGLEGIRGSVQAGEQRVCSGFKTSERLLFQRLRHQAVKPGLQIMSESFFKARFSFCGGQTYDIGLCNLMLQGL